ncbi:MAG: bis(5'-nucleosyl)-tetraphosphatase (symmetrical) YqeK [Clostridium sp.]|nr:bis(5'-nucleosyl)-tetraphosphatase (symmetrical) YqeK [Clostridium sp.]
MKNIEFMKKYLEENLVKGRYLHTLGVAETAKKLAKIYGVDIKKAEIAALAHDIAKNLSMQELLEVIEENNIALSFDEKNTRELWHSIIGPIIARERFEIEDEEILSAIRWHTTGKENMSNLDKIIYLADMIEPSRDFLGVEELRNDSKDDLDKAVLNALTHSIEYLLKKGCLIDINTVKARNYLLYNNYK